MLFCVQKMTVSTRGLCSANFGVDCGLWQELKNCSVLMEIGLADDEALKLQVRPYQVIGLSVH